MNAVPRVPRGYAGPALFSYGFRPFFLFSALYSAAALLVWLPLFFGDIELATALSPRDWHAHEMLYGYLPAVITGFLLTAVPNWTGRLPLQGGPLLFLVLVWAAGRVAMVCASAIGAELAAGIDIAFLFVVAAAVGREVIAGKNWRNLKVLLPVTILAIGNVIFHVEAFWRGSAEYGQRIGIAAIVVLIMLIGGRIIPSFTRNWLARNNPGRLPTPFRIFDAAALAISAAALGLWVFIPHSRITAGALFVCAVLQAARLARWAGDRTLRDKLVVVLHIAYGFIPLGFALTGLAAAGIVLPSAGIHAWMIGGAGTMTLSVMTRASLGHTGRALHASAPTQAIYVAVLVAAAARIGAALISDWMDILLHVAALAWITAFGTFAVVYGPMLLRPRRQTRQ